MSRDTSSSTAVPSESKHEPVHALRIIIPALACTFAALVLALVMAFILRCFQRRRATSSSRASATTSTTSLKDKLHISRTRPSVNQRRSDEEDDEDYPAIWDNRPPAMSPAPPPPAPSYSSSYTSFSRSDMTLSPTLWASPVETLVYPPNLHPHQSQWDKPRDQRENGVRPAKTLFDGEAAASRASAGSPSSPSGSRTSSTTSSPLFFDPTREREREREYERKPRPSRPKSRPADIYIPSPQPRRPHTAPSSLVTASPPRKANLLAPHGSPPLSPPPPIHLPSVPTRSRRDRNHSRSPSHPPSMRSPRHTRIKTSRDSLELVSLRGSSDVAAVVLAFPMPPSR